MKKFIVLLSLILAVAVNAQTNTPPAPPSLTLTNEVPTLPEHVSTLLNFLSASSTNWYVAPYAIYVSDTDSFGGGLAAAYSFSPYILSVLRVDYLDGKAWMPSGSLQLQLPIKLMDKVTVTPFAFAGIATPLSGRDEDNGTATGIAGSGLATRFTQHLGLVYDIEMWSGWSGPQHRFGVYWKF